MNLKLLNDFQIKSILYKLSDYDIAGVIPYVSELNDVFYVIFFRHKGHLFLKNIHFYDANTTDGCYNFNQFLQKIEDALRVELLDIERELFNLDKLDEYNRNSFNEVVRRRVMDTSYIYRSLKGFNDSYALMLNFYQCNLFFSKYYKKNLSCIEIYTKILDRFLMSEEITLDYIKNFDASLLEHE